MAYEVYYGDTPLHDYVTVLNVKRTILPSRENQVKDASGIFGSIYLGYKYAAKTITLECSLITYSKEEYLEGLKALGYVLDVKEPQKMVISDAPDRYCYAILSGDTEPEKSFYTGKVTLTFMCYDPYDYANDWKSVEAEYINRLAPTIRVAILHNEGSVETYPVLSFTFSKEAYFAQCSNDDGQVVLVGTPPSGDKDSVDIADANVLEDECETLDGWLNTGLVIDNGTIDGDLTINESGYAITCTNYGSNAEGWHGGARRKNLSREVENFKIKINMEHISTMSKSDATNTTTGNYYVSHSPSINVRSGRSKKYKKLGSLKKGTILNVTNIRSGWGQIVYEGKTGYVYMNYLTKASSNDSSSKSGSYKVTADPYIRIRKSRGTKYKQIGTIKKGVTVSVTSIKSGWGKVNYSGKTGYVYMKYMKKISASTRADEITDVESVEDRMSRCELYGFDSNGNKLFKVAMNDLSSYYEYSEPVIQIGSKDVYTDGLKVPAANRTRVKENGKWVSKKIDSGAYGKWNKFKGTFTISRTTKDGKQYWECDVKKFDSGWNNVIEHGVTGVLQNESYPKGKLSNILIWMGAFKDKPPVDVCNVTKIDVEDLNPIIDVEDKNVPIFKAGDELTIDFSDGSVKLNDENFLDQLDLGSYFFGCESGDTPIAIMTDDGDADVQIDYQERWL